MTADYFGDRQNNRVSPPVDHEYDPTKDSENQVDLTEKNLALQKVATSSSIMTGGEPEKGVDGNSEGNFFG